ncbi:kinase anchor protein [Halocalculus aciditolerans]|uniref:Serine protein kinase n=1 Tax=Halocalculus aciditolerans TaxID=1383812 RepID=A0A830F3I6_9EURY|nr:kinase anchor protein [Halocalculus aciditolerans]GGL59030.1 serine protein kinase [Halocalculus aciditolerans]
MTSNYIASADAALTGAYDDPLSLREFVDSLAEHPERAAGATEYVLAAVESFGTRPVIEDGEELERYRFFDDPANDGEHAVLGNSRELNGFVEDLRAIASGRAKAEKILWFAGPTATGKSEFKRCLVAGLRAYSQTPAGRRYTVEWNVASGDGGGADFTYGDGIPVEREDDWYASPVQSHPLSVFPPGTRAEILADAGVLTPALADIDPFCREAYDVLEERYRRAGRDDLFTAVSDPGHVRVKNYVVDVGRGVGVLHAEDAGTPKERLVGSWMPELLASLDSRGRKNPQAFSYDGVLSQGNGGVTVVEDATQHADLLQKLLNVPDEKRVKLDKGVGMDLDTQLVVISNLDLEATLNQHADRQSHDPLKALKRRLDKREFTYLTNVSLEAQLLRRELAGATELWTDTDADAIDERVRAPLVLPGGRDGGERELAPHAVEAAALFDVVTRLDETGELSLVEKALLYDAGELGEGDDVRTREDFDFDDETEGRTGVPVTYTRDVVADLLAERSERRHPDLAVESVVMPADVLDALAARMDDAPVLSRAERETFRERVDGVRERVLDRQTRDVFAAATADVTVDAETVADYVEHVYAWATGGDVEDAHGERVEPDALRLKVFETEHLGRFDESDYRGVEPRSAVSEFREGTILPALNRHAWESRTTGFAVGDVDLTDIPVIRSVLEATDAEDVARAFPDLDPAQWAEPPEGTETARVKAATVERLVADAGYTPASAELTSRAVMAEVEESWD